MPFVQNLQHSITKRLDRGDNEQASGRGKFPKILTSLEQMLDLRGKVERQGRKLLVHCPNHTERVFWSVQKVGIAECDVRSARADLLADVLQDHILRQDKESAAVHRWNRAMSAQMQAAPTRFHI